jgi:SNF2 family DNA or RNA helicase
VSASQFAQKSNALDLGITYKLPPLADYQRRGVECLATVPIFPLFADCGVGKTYMALVSSEHHIKTGVVRRGKTLICAKLSTLHSGWLADALKFTDLKVVCLWLSTSYKKKEKIKKLMESDADVFLINHDGVRVYEEDLVAMNFEKVIVDESTILKSFRSERKGVKGGSFGRALHAVSHNARWKVIMSGTPAPNGIHDLWGQFYFLDKDGFLLEKTFANFKAAHMAEKVFGKKSDPLAPRTWVPKESSIPVVKELIMPLAYRVRLRDHITDMPDKTVMQRMLPMSAEQEKHYKELATKFYTEIDGEHITVTMALSLMGKFRQVTGGFLYDVLKNPHPIENPKLDELDSLLEDEISRDEKVVIFAQYEHEIETIKERYKGHGLVTVYGGNSGKENVANIQRFIEDKKTRIVLLHPKSGAHGITFTVAHYMIFYSSSFSAEEDYQCVRRIERAGQKNAMFIYYLSCSQSIDEVMYEVVQEKHKAQAALIDHDSEGVTMALYSRFKLHLAEKYPQIFKKRKGGRKNNDESQ